MGLVTLTFSRRDPRERPKASRARINVWGDAARHHVTRSIPAEPKVRDHGKWVETPRQRATSAGKPWNEKYLFNPKPLSKWAEAEAEALLARKKKTPKKGQAKKAKAEKPQPQAVSAPVGTLASDPDYGLFDTSVRYSDGVTYGAVEIRDAVGTLIAIINPNKRKA